MWIDFDLPRLAVASDPSGLDLEDVYRLLDRTQLTACVHHALAYEFLMSVCESNNSTVTVGVADVFGHAGLEDLIEAFPSRESLAPTIIASVRRVIVPRSMCYAGYVYEISASVHLNLDVIQFGGLRLAHNSVSPSLLPVTASEAPAHEDWTMLFRVAFANGVSPYRLEDMMSWLGRLTDNRAAAWIERVGYFYNQPAKWKAFVAQRIDRKSIPDEGVSRLAPEF